MTLSLTVAARNIILGRGGGDMNQQRRPNCRYGVALDADTFLRDDGGT